MARLFRYSIIAAVSLSFAACSSHSDVSEKIAIGRAHFQGYGCTTCHQVGGKGGILGPDLTFVGFRKSADWIDLWLKSPEGWKHNTLMPNFYLKEPVREALGVRASEG